MKLENFIRGFDFSRRRGALYTYDLDIKKIVTVPEKADINSIYVAVKTPLGDGFHGAAAAYSRGCRVFVSARVLDLPPNAAEFYTASPEIAVSILAAKCYGACLKGLTVLGVTGTHGKTSVVESLAALLRKCGRRVATLSTDGITSSKRFLPHEGNAPCVTDVWEFLQRAHGDKAEFAILEFSSYMLAQKAHLSIPFAALLLTDYAPCHVGTVHESEAAYRAAKQALFNTNAPLSLLPYDCDAITASRRVVRYGRAGEILLKEAIPVGRDGVSITLSLNGEEIRFFYPMVGDFAYKNALAVAAMAFAVGLSPAEIAAGMPAALPKGRLECLFADDGKRIYLDAAYEGEALARVLKALRGVTEGRLSVLFGAVGGRAVARRVPLGEAAFNHADFVWLTADDPDAEPPEKIAEEIVGVYFNSAAYRICPSREKAIAMAVDDLQPGDTLLILGKPREDTQLIHGQKKRFSDRLKVQSALKKQQ